MSIFDRFKKPVEVKGEIGTVKLPIEPRYLERMAKDIKKWRDAQEDAELLDYPDRLELMKIYKDLMDDSQIFACTQIRTNKSTNGKAWIYDESDEPVEELNKMFFNSKGQPLYWFRQFLINVQFSKYYGNVCLQVIKGDQIQVKRLPEENLLPQWNGFIFNIETGFTLQSNFARYDEPKYKNYLIPVGDPKDLGLLNKVAPYMIWKEVFGSWSMHADIYGQPLRIGKTDIRDKDRRKNMIDMLAGMSKSTYGVLDTTDLVEFIESSKGDPHNIYKELINACDAAISKIILGGTGIIDEKAFVGSAEIQNTLLGDIIYSDKLDLAAVVNNDLIPRFQKLGIIKEGKYSMVWDFDETLSLMDWATVIQQLSMAGYKMPNEEVEAKMGITLMEQPEIEVPEKDKPIIESLTKMYNLYKDYE